MSTDSQPKSAILHPQTQVGAIHLTVSDLNRATDFYLHSLGMDIRMREEGSVVLGTGYSPLVYLTEQPDAIRPHRTTGLYHLAILLPTRRELAHAIGRLTGANWPIQGFADHGVSEAVYLADPDGNGIELYRDRPFTEWRMRPDGQVAMGTDPLDVHAVMGELKGQPVEGQRMHPDTIIGHVHLRVSDLDASVQFYRDVLGFDLTNQSLPGAAFFSAGGYHHHVGVNTWAGTGIPAPPENALGLRHFEIRVPDRADMDRIIARLAKAGLPYEQRHDGFLVRDPSRNGVLITNPN